MLGWLPYRYRCRLYNLGYRIGGALDGMPFPPSRLINMVIGTTEISWFQMGGVHNTRAFTTVLYRNGIVVEDVKTMLDFGCGCGRILRWLKTLKDSCEMWGCDYNPELIDWCRKRLGHLARFKVNRIEPPLDFPDATFELVYSYSVFTHLADDLQRPWFAELARVLRPGGALLVTVHGRRCALANAMGTDDLDRLEEDGLVVYDAELAGSNNCVAYHSERYMNDLSDLGLEVIEHLPAGTRDIGEQDIYLLRKAPGPSLSS
jgi:SAM-dependent methyltransferase